MASSTRRPRAGPAPATSSATARSCSSDWKTEQEVVVKKSQTYWDAAHVRLNAIHFYPTENSDSEERDFRAGLLHVTYDLPHHQDRRLPRALPAVAPDLALPRGVLLPFQRHQPRDEGPARAARVGHGHRPRGIVKDVARGGQLPAHGLTPPDHRRLHFAAAASRPITTPRASCSPRRVIPAARGCRRWKSSSTPARTTARSPRSSSRCGARNSTSTRASTNQELKVYLDSQHTLNYDFARGAGSAITPTRSRSWACSSSAAATNDTGLIKPGVRPAHRRIRRRADRRRAAGGFPAGRDAPARRAPVAPIYFYTHAYLLQPSVKGWYPNILDRHMPKFIYLEETAPTEFKRLPAGRADA